MAADGTTARATPVADLLPNIIYIDSSVGSREFDIFFTGKRPRFPHRAAIAKLPAADFAFACGHGARSPYCAGDFGCRVGIERKTIGDLVSSLLNNRLGGFQLPNMLADYTFVYILVEGIWRPGDDNSIEVWERGQWRQSRYALTYSQLSSWLTRYDVMGAGQIHRWRTSSQVESAAFVASTFQWWRKEWKEHSAIAVDKIPVAQKVLTFKPNQLQRTAASLEAIGVENMKKVSRHFHTIQDLVNADLKGLQAAGLKRADALKVFRACRTEYR